MTVTARPATRTPGRFTEADCSLADFAALVEQTAAASQSMGDQAHQLQQLMGFFKLTQHAMPAKEALTGTTNARPAPARHAVPPGPGALARRQPATGKGTKPTLAHSSPTQQAINTDSGWEEF